MELKIEEYQLPDQIRFNFEELKAELIEKVQIYETMVYDDDQIKEAKADRAKLSKLKKALNDERIKREKEYMIPFNAFKAQVNEIIGIIDKPVLVIDRQVKEYEERQKAEKRIQIGAYYTDETDHPDWLNLPLIFDERWLNASVSLKNVKDQIDERLEKIKTEVATIESLQEFSFEAMTEYKRTLDISRAIAEGQRLANIQKQKLEAEQRAAEQKRLQEEAAAKIREVEENIQNRKDPEADAVLKEALESAPEEEKGNWISFRAYLTVAQALQLKEFFTLRNIKFEPIKED